MKHVLLSICVLVGSIGFMAAQPGFIPAQSPVTLVYRIDNQTAGRFYRGKQKLSGRTLQHCVDTLRGIAAGLPAAYPDGHYMLVHSNGNMLQCRLVSVVPFEHQMLNNQRDMALAVVDRKTGQIIHNAKVKVGNKRIRYDGNTHSYRRKKTDKQGTLTIEVDGLTAYYNVERKYNMNLWKRMKSGLWNAPVVKYVSRPVMFVAAIPGDTYRSIRNLRPVGSIYHIQKPFSDIYKTLQWMEPVGWIDGLTRMFDRYDHNGNGFVVFSKPKYRPGDTIRFKAFVSTKKHQPVTDSLTVSIRTDKRQVIGKLKPYSPGFYAMDVVPQAGWGMKLDKQYSITLTNGDVLQNGYFYYEDYELQSIQYHIRTEKTEYLAHEEAVFYARAADENNMPAPDARVELALIAEKVNDFSGRQLLVPNRLWSKEMNLDPVGETKIVVPDSVWPAASLNVQLVAAFSNSDNQTAKKELRFTRKNTPERMVMTQKADSLYLYYENSGKPVQGVQVKLSRGLPGDTVLTLPHRIKIHPLVERYQATLMGKNYALPLAGNPKLFENAVSHIGAYQPAFPSVEFVPSAEHSGVSCSMSRVHDSVLISVNNPLRLPLSYTVFKGNREQQRGTGTLGEYKAKASAKDYFLSVQYIWGGREHQLEYRLAYDAAQLKLNTMLPAIVYPGQRVKVDILATDAGNRPMPGVDLTAWGNTAKFGNLKMPSIPSYQKPPSERKTYNAFSSSKKQDVNRSKKMDYPHWQSPLKLDSVEFYRFAYPGKKVYRYDLPSADGKTYIAPYLVHDGKLLPIQILYVNDRPVYFGKSTTDAPYAFPVEPDNHAIRIRTSDGEVYFRIQVYQGRKNIISIDPYEWNREVEIGLNAVTTGRFTGMKDKYSPSELYLLRNYLIPVRFRNNNYFPYLEYNGVYEILSPKNYQNSLVTGAVGNSDITLLEEGRPVNTFRRDGYEWFEYEPLPGILKMRTIPFDNSFEKKPPRFDWKKLPYSKHEIDSITFRRQQARLQNSIRTAFVQTSSKLQVETTLCDSIQAKAWCWVLYDRKCQESRFYPLTERTFAVASDGVYELFLLMADKSYYRFDSLQLAANAINMMRFDIGEMKRPSQPVDSLITHRQILKDIASYGGMYVTIPPQNEPRPAPVIYNPDYKNSIEVCGIITDNTGEPLPGVNVIVKGTAVGMVTDINGRYCIRIPDGYRTLTYSFIGFTTAELTPLESGTGNVEMHEDVRALEEVIVVGYGTQKKYDLTGSVAVSSVLQGKLAGVIASDAGQNIAIRGISSVNSPSPMPYTVDAQDVMKQMQEDEAYQTGLASAKGLRTDFSDEAFWQPKLVTDRQGVATFETTFPDDVTKWNIGFIGLIPGKASATAQAEVRSLKPLMGQLAVPRFMVEGDTANVIGKVINYTSDSIRVHTSFAVDKAVKTDKEVTVRHSLIDTLAVVAPEKLPIDLPGEENDSIAVSYQLTRADGYRDGEQRHIPVVRRGTIEHIGQFHVLDTDTAVTLSFDVSKGPVTLSMESSELDILMKEVRRMRDYKHLCNEQTASRLKALLLERKAYQLSGKDYPYDRHIRSLIRRLLKERNDQGLWGWFGNSNQETWISTHVAEALLQARDDGFKFDFDFSTLVQRLLLQYDKSSDPERIGILTMLIRVNPENNYRSLYDKIDDKNFRSYTERLKWMELSLFFGAETDINRVLENKKTDKSGNIHWTEYAQNQWMFNNVTATLAAYRLLRKQGNHERILRKIRNYLLKERDIYYGWRNTYESVGILTAIMPDILEESKGRASKPKIDISGAYRASVDTFPKHITINGNEPITLTKTGSLPVYVTAWQKKYIPEPDAANEGFRVTTVFSTQTAIDSRTGRTAAVLTAGKAATLEVTVSSDVSSEYVLVEIPIPAGCSYQSKPQSWYWRSGETHREYFRDRVCIYLRRLERGSHTYLVELMPRYTGAYYVNPAKAEQMYLPLFFGRTGVKPVKVVD